MNIYDKANAAMRLQENEDFKAVIGWIEADIFAAFKSTKIGNSEELSNVHALSHGFKLVTDRIAKYIEQGKFESAKDEER